MQLLQGPIATLMCLSLLAPANLASAQSPEAPAVRPKARPAYQSGQLHGDDRILHALNRFTFGPRPGDLEAVRSIGLEDWLDQQLHPESLDESVLDAQLAKYPAMQWSTQDLIFSLPGNAILRQAINGKFNIPQSGILHAVYQNQIDRINEKREQKEQKNAAPQTPPQAPSAASMNTAMTMAADVDAGESPNSMTKEPAATQADSPPNPANLADVNEPTANQPGQMAMTAPAAAVQPSANLSIVSDLLALPPQQRVARLASIPQPDFDAFFKSLRGPERAALVVDLNPEQKQTVAALAGPERVVVEELIAERLTRDIYSNAQLQEVMTDFWLNHFNIYLRKNEQMPYYLVSYARDTIRPHALGKFEDLLEATAHSPAMLLYLDNSSSMGPDSIAAERAKDNAWRHPNAKRKAPEGINENYARELMELHTVGVNGGYTQADVIQAARILTGWTIEQPLRGGGFVFNPNRHEPGTDKVMGQKFKDNGEQQGHAFLHFLATRPATARFISRELAERFVSDNPPPALVDRMAHTYMSSGGDISAVLKTLFHSPEFWSTSVYRAKVKTPLEYVVSAVRASNANIENLRPLANALRQMGMPLYGCVPPTGYSWQESAWVSTGALVDRMNFALALAANHLPGIKVDWASEVSSGALQDVNQNSPAASPESAELRLESLLVPGGVSVATRSAVLDQFQQQSAQDSASGQPVNVDMRPNFHARSGSSLARQDQLLAGLLLGSPEFQRR